MLPCVASNARFGCAAGAEEAGGSGARWRQEGVQHAKLTAPAPSPSPPGHCPLVVRVLLACETRESVGAHWQLLLNPYRVRRAQAPAATKTVNPLFEKRPKTFGARLASSANKRVCGLHRRCIGGCLCVGRLSETALSTLRACWVELSDSRPSGCRRRRGAAAEAGPAPIREVAQVRAHPAAAAGAEPAAEGAAGAQPLHQDAGQEHSTDALQAAPQVQVSFGGPLPLDVRTICTLGKAVCNIVRLYHLHSMLRCVASCV